MCETLSLARAQIALDQIRSALKGRDAERVFFITAGPFTTSDLPLAAVLGIQIPSQSNGKLGGDSATIVHAGSLRPLQQYEKSDLAATISEQLDQRLRDRGIEFVQWSTDDIATPSGHALATWCSGLGFAPLATLNYLSGPINLQSSIEEWTFTGSHTIAVSDSLTLESVDWTRDNEPNAFAEFVDQTYRETQDCPMLAQHRTAIQTLQGYQTSNAFAPQWWFRLIDPVERKALGCLVLALHRGPEIVESESTHEPARSDQSEQVHSVNANEQPSRADAVPRDLGGDVVEIVYMGLIPSARGRGLGSQLVRIAKGIARDHNCARIILAVDQENRPAVSIYHRAGLQFVLSETVWVKSLPTNHFAVEAK
jgi:ribosomal protein S18 acetylase RimI-like enzyme